MGFCADPRISRPLRRRQRWSDRLPVADIRPRWLITPEISNVVRLRHPDDIDDPLTNVLRAGARRLLAQAVGLEVEAFLADLKDLKLPDGRARIVRHGHGPERSIQTGIGPVGVSRPKVRDRGAAAGEERIRFTSAILPRWSRRSRSLDALLPVLYLRQQATSRRPWRRCSARMPPICRRPSSAASRPSGRPSTSIGRRGICRRGATSTCGRTGSTSKPEWRSRPSACWC